MPRAFGRVVFFLASTLALGCDDGSPQAPSADCGYDCVYTPSTDVPPLGSPVATHGALSVLNGALVDQNGEPVQLKGISSMWLNWETNGYAQSRKGLEWLRDNWRVSLIRAAMGVEEQSGYLREPVKSKSSVHQVVQHAIELGLYVLIDWHDHHAEDHQAQAQTFFEQFATTYGEYPNVIYEDFNEPLDLDWSSTLKPYHEALVASIRSIDGDNPIVLGTPNWSQRVADAAADPLSGDNLLYTLHFYACSHGQWLRDDGETALGLGLPLFVTEWGATQADGGVQDKTVCVDDALAWHAWLDQHAISWAAWKLDGCNDASCLFKIGAPVQGPFTDAWLNGHGPFVRDRLLE